jgi:hypothetical protein
MRALTPVEATCVTGATGCRPAPSCQPAPTPSKPRKSALTCLVDFAYFTASLFKPRACTPKPVCGGTTPTPTNPPVDL